MIKEPYCQACGRAINPAMVPRPTPFQGPHCGKMLHRVQRQPTTGQNVLIVTVVSGVAALFRSSASNFTIVGLSAAGILVLTIGAMALLGYTLEPTPRADAEPDRVAKPPSA